MTAGQHPLAAELPQEVARASDFREACSVLLASVLARSSFRKGALALRHEDDRWHIRSGFGESRHSAELERAGTAVEGALRAEEPRLLEDQDAVLGLDFRPCVVLPFRDLEDAPMGAILLEAEGLDEEACGLGDAVRRSGPALARLQEVERLRSRVRGLEHENALLGRIQDQLVDPVILTDHRNDILVANRRALELFSSPPGASLGRTRAVHTNTFLFSAFLTQGQIADSERRPRELGLVDPADGSDLLFEVLTTPLPRRSGEERQTISVLRDITDLKRAVNELELEYKRSRIAEQRARRESQRMNAIIENAAEPILVTDGQSRIVLMNAEAERLFDLPEDLAEGDRRRRLWTNVTRFTSLVNEFLLRPDVRRKEQLELAEPSSGGSFPVEVVNTKILDRLDEPVAVVTVLRDLTQEVENERLAEELRSLNEKLEERIEIATAELAERNRLLVWQSQELEKASRLKSEFLARMSHELRTPINAMLGYTSLLREHIFGELTNEQEKALDKIRAASEHLLTLISEILDLSKIEAGKMPVKLETIRLDELVSEIAQTLGPMFEQEGLAFHSEMAESLPALHTDPTKLRQVLLNLLENALKYTPEGHVAVRAAPAAAGSVVRIEVEDTGIGIREEDLEMVFEDFRQADQSITREQGGTGLGLSISRKLLALMGGTISVRSRFGEGSVFTVELPLRMEPGSVNEQARRVLIESARTAVSEDGRPETAGSDAARGRPSDAVSTDDPMDGG